jgi:membrane protein implicated in regulation of membrane protease activity
VNDKNKGRVKLAGDDWRAESFDNAPIDLGKQVEVVKVNSTILIVKTI